ncbi:MAG: TonB-dependent receptor [Bacteroidales bacterium]|nr:TonB-dependent receptor [Bacteroidales bacterium]
MKAKFTVLLLALFCSISLIAQNVTVKGTVLDEYSEPVIGASVTIKGQPGQGATTDLDGHFQISVANGKNLVISYIGYDSSEYHVTGATNDVVIKLQPNVTALDEVVAVGYGVQKKSVMSSSVARVTSEDLDLGHPTTVQNALKGKVSGVQIISNSGQPGADSKILVRGTGTVNSAGPLYIIDGMPSESGINHLNPSDIASIEVLKDAASAAIYGARGANGVVLVTTKSGAYDQKASLSYEFTYGIQNPSKKIRLANTREYMVLAREAAANANTPFVLQGNADADTDWQEEIRYKNAPIMNHRVSLSGGSANSTYYASFGYVGQDGIYAKDHAKYQRYNFRVNYSNVLMDYKDRNWLSKATFTAMGAFTQSKTTGSTIGNSEAAGILTSVNMLPPTQAVYQTDPAILAQYEAIYPNHVVAPNGQAYNIFEMREITNPLASMQVNNNQVSKPRTFSYNFAFDLDVWNGIKFKTSYASEYVMNEIKNVVPVYQLNTTNNNTNSYVTDQKNNSTYWQWENVLSYNKTFGEHTVGALVGTTMSSYHFESMWCQDYDLLEVNIDKGYIDIATAAESESKVSSNGSDHRIASVFGRVNYNYAERYLLEAVLRRDGSSNFGRKYQYATFPSVSVGWVATREPFIEKILPNWFNFAKVRFSWGRNGNENIGAFMYTSMMGKHFTAIYGGEQYTSMLPTGFANADLKWETAEQTDLGLDLRFMNNALTFTVDYFNKKTKDMLLNMPIPMYTSFSTMTINAGTVKNEGVEMEASYRQRVGNVNFSVGANASYVKNTMTDQGPDRIGLNSLGGGMGGQVSYRENGRPYGFFYGYVTDGVFQNEAEIAAYPHMEGVQPGDLKFVDITGDGRIDADDRTMIGKPNPDWTFGLNLAAEWKGFDASLFFQGATGADIYKLYRRPNITGANYEAFWLGRWHGEGTSNTIPRVVENDSYNYQVNDFFVEDGSYLRLKVAQLGYTMPRAITLKAGIQKFRVFIQGENLFTATNYTGYDPEVGTRDGFDGGTYPQARTYTIGANIVF